jgi:hypothetical protein
MAPTQFWPSILYIMMAMHPHDGRQVVTVLLRKFYHNSLTQIFIAYLGVTWISCAIVLFGQRKLHQLTNFFGAFCLCAWFVSLMVCAIMPSRNGSGYASSAFVWKEWNNQTGYTSNGFVFCLGMLNGAFGIGMFVPIRLLQGASYLTIILRNS